MTEAPILVTVLVVTYNHEPYIAAAIDSALVQKTSFPVEIVISEDASTDGTRAIVQRFAAANPDRVDGYLFRSKHPLERSRRKGTSPGSRSLCGTA